MGARQVRKMQRRGHGEAREYKRRQVMNMEKRERGNGMVNRGETTREQRINKTRGEDSNMKVVKKGDKGKKYGEEEG